MPVGDETVPGLSAAGQFLGDSRIDVVEVTEGDRTHTGLLANPAVQTGILSVLGVDARDVRLSSGLAIPSKKAVLSAVIDPVGSLITDGEGRRLGWTPETGPLAEIPGSAWYGEGDGFGIILGEVIQPLSVALVGLGGDYLVQMTGQLDGRRVGLLAEGELAEGSTQNLTLETRDALPPAEVESDGGAQLQQAASRLVKIVIIAVVTVVVLAALAVLVLVLVLRKRRRE